MQFAATHGNIFLYRFPLSSKIFTDAKGPRARLHAYMDVMTVADSTNIITFRLYMLSLNMCE